MRFFVSLATRYGNTLCRQKGTAFFPRTITWSGTKCCNWGSEANQRYAIAHLINCSPRKRARDTPRLLFRLARSYTKQGRPTASESSISLSTFCKSLLYAPASQWELCIRVNLMRWWGTRDDKVGSISTPFVKLTQWIGSNIGGDGRLVGYFWVKGCNCVRWWRPWWCMIDEDGSGCEGLWRHAEGELRRVDEGNWFCEIVVRWTCGASEILEEMQRRGESRTERRLSFGQTGNKVNA